MDYVIIPAFLIWFLIVACTGACWEYYKCKRSKELKMKNSSLIKQAMKTSFNLLQLASELQLLQSEMEDSKASSIEIESIQQKMKSDLMDFVAYLGQGNEKRK